MDGECICLISLGLPIVGGSFGVLDWFDERIGGFACGGMVVFMSLSWISWLE